MEGGGGEERKGRKEKERWEWGRTMKNLVKELKDREMKDTEEEGGRGERHSKRVKGGERKRVEPWFTRAAEPALRSRQDSSSTR